MQRLWTSVLVHTILQSTMLRLLVLCLIFGVGVNGEGSSCEVVARTSSGRVCGLRLQAAGGGEYASFLGVPYAKPPLGELRFKKLQPADPWDDLYNATVERDICPQTDILYERLMAPRGMSEDCIHANIHVPIKASSGENNNLSDNMESTGLPIFVFVHGGAFAFGSGDTDIHGPDQLVANDVIVITFNYRLNVFGFLSLNSTEIPGNNGLRDIITMLKWVKKNAKSFGGNPNDITLGGHSAGAISVSLLTLSPASKGLFNKAVSLSGPAISNFYTTSPVYANTTALSFLTALGITSTDPTEIHQLLIEMPIENITQVHADLLNTLGLGVFYPVTESPLPGIETILPEDPYTMLAKGNGKDIPLLIGYTNKETESFRNRMEEIDIMTRISQNPVVVAPVPVPYRFTEDVALNKSLQIEDRYFEGAPTLDKYIKASTDSLFEHPVLKTAVYRQQSGGAATYVYKYSYEAVYNPVEIALGLDFYGAGHVEDLLDVFKANSIQVPSNEVDDAMNSLMTGYIINFIKYGSPVEDDSWRPVGSELWYQAINSPTDSVTTTPTSEQTSILEFFDGILEI